MFDSFANVALTLCQEVAIRLHHVTGWNYRKSGVFSNRLKNFWGLQSCFPASRPCGVGREPCEECVGDGKRKLHNRSSHQGDTVPCHSRSKQQCSRFCWRFHLLTKDRLCKIRHTLQAVFRHCRHQMVHEMFALFSHNDRLCFQAVVLMQGQKGFPYDILFLKGGGIICLRVWSSCQVSLFNVC